MELYGPVGMLYEGWHEDDAVRRVLSYGLPGSMFSAVMGDGVWAVSAIGYVAGVGLIVSGRYGDPGASIIAVVGGGLAGGRSWSVWRTVEWSRRAEVPDAAEIESLEARATFLRKWLREWHEARAKDPTTPMRPHEQYEEELEDIEERLAFARGTLWLVIYVGHAKRWKGWEFVLRV